ncbi:MAG: response regulator [Dehalococcoidales bacterium]|nr:MAG: response regulator [Dehalococcoidales bacterium]
MDKIKVLIGGFQALYRKGIRYMLSQDDSFTIIGESITRADTYEKVKSDLPDLVIMDADNAEFSGIDITNDITQNFSDVKVILIMDNQNTENLLAAIKSGAKACLSNIADQNVLKNTLKKVIQGKILISQYLLEPDISTSILNDIRASKTIDNGIQELLSNISHIEEVILVKISDGTLVADITSSLNITEDEFANHLESIVRKLVDIEAHKRKPKLDGISGVSDEYREEIIQESQEVSTETEEDTKPVEEGKEQGEKSRDTEKFDISVKEILKMVQLAREAERLSTYEEVNGEMKHILEALNDEIERRQRSLRRVQNAIEEELEFGKKLETTWNKLDKRRTKNK